MRLEKKMLRGALFFQHCCLVNGVCILPSEVLYMFVPHCWCQLFMLVRSKCQGDNLCYFPLHCQNFDLLLLYETLASYGSTR